MLRFIARAVAVCGSIASITLLAPAASAQLLVHPPQQRVGPNAADIGPNPEAPEEPEFGTAIALRSELAFIGMPARSPGGTVAVFSATPTQLIRTGTLSPSDPVTHGSFGRLLTYRDGILVVGSQHAAYIFKRNSTGVWTQRQKITLPARALSYEDGTLAIAASGEVYIYERNTAGQFVSRGKLVLPDGSIGAFGAAIGMAGPVMVASGIGSVHVFRRSSTGVWRHRQTLIASELGTEEGARAGFGSAVAIDRGMIIVGAPDFSGADPFSSEGAAYGFVIDGALYVETFKLQPEGFTAGFGQQIAMFGERIVVRATTGISTDCDGWQESAFSYTRAGSSVLPRGVAFSPGNGHSMALADQRLLVGTSCLDSRFPTPGRALLFRLNVFR
jgi:FG-GAP repeat